MGVKIDIRDAWCSKCKKTVKEIGGYFKHEEKTAFHTIKFGKKPPVTTSYTTVKYVCLGCEKFGFRTLKTRSGKGAEYCTDNTVYEGAKAPDSFEGSDGNGREEHS